MQSIKKLCRLVVCFLGGAAFTVQAEDLLEIYFLALENDLPLKIAEQQFEVSTNSAIIAKSAIKPSLFVNASYNENETRNTNRLLDSEIVLRGDSKNYGLTLSQPLFDLNKWFSYQGGKLIEKQAKINLTVAQQDLILRLVNAYLGVLSAQDSLKSALARKKSVELQLARAQRAFEVGDASASNVNDAKASLDNQTLTVLNRQNALFSAQENLVAIVGVRFGKLTSLKENFSAQKPSPSNPESWVEKALEGSFTLKGSEVNLSQSKISKRAAQWLYAPTVAVSASYNRDSGSSGNVPFSNENESANISLNFNMPLYVGGAEIARRRSANSQLEEAKYQFENTKRNVAKDARNKYFDILSAVSRIKTLKNAIQSAEKALASTQRGFEEGERTVVELLEAEQRVFDQKLAYSNARYQYISDTLRMKRITGTLSPEDVVALNQWFSAIDEKVDIEGL